MSTLATTNIKHPSSASNNIVLDSAGGVDLDALTVSGSAPADSVNIDASGRLLVGTSSASSSQIFAVQGRVTDANSYANIGLRRGSAPTGGNPTLAVINFCDNNENAAAYIAAGLDPGTWTPGSSHPGYLAFSTTANGASSPTERMRIESGGLTIVRSTGNGLYATTNDTAGTSIRPFICGHTATGMGQFTVSMHVYSNGNIQNTNNSYGAISDIKFKENIVDASSQWSDIKNLRVRNFNLIEGQTHRQIGVIAQEVETISPGLVYESPDHGKDGNDLGTVTKSVNYSVLYMKAVKALQEAMERIEALEADVAQLKGA
jgi:hypothetical protein